MKKQEWLDGLDFDPDKAIDISNNLSHSLRHEIELYGGLSGVFQEVLPKQIQRNSYDFVVIFVEVPTDFEFPEKFKDFKVHEWDIEEDGKGYPIVFSEDLSSLEKAYDCSEYLHEKFNYS